MGKLVESTFVSLDGSIENPQNWSPPYWDDEHRAYATKLLWDADALLLGRKTYEGFAQAWPPAPARDEFTDRMNAMPKYVASTSLEGTDLAWNASVLEGDTVEAIRMLTAGGGSEPAQVRNGRASTGRSSRTGSSTSSTSGTSPSSPAAVSA